MSQIIYQFRNFGRCSTKIFEDVQIAKMYYDHQFVPNREDIIIKSFIQEIRLYKFGYLLYSEKQVNYLFYSSLDILFKVVISII